MSSATRCSTKDDPHHVKGLQALLDTFEKHQDQKTPELTSPTPKKKALTDSVPLFLSPLDSEVDSLQQLRSLAMPPGAEEAMKDVEQQCSTSISSKGQPKVSLNAKKSTNNHQSLFSSKELPDCNKSDASPLPNAISEIAEQKSLEPPYDQEILFKLSQSPTLPPNVEKIIKDDCQPGSKYPGKQRLRVLGIPVYLENAHKYAKQPGSNLAEETYGKNQLKQKTPQALSKVEKTLEHVD